MLTRKTPLKRRPLLRGHPILRRTRLKKASKKRAAQLKEYGPLRRKFLDDNPRCRAGPRWGVHFSGCTHEATQIHHMCRRGPHLNDLKTFLPICDSCHRYLETHANLARALGMLQ